MVKLQRMTDGSFFMILRKALIEARGWKKGDEIALFEIGGAIIPEKGDVFIRKMN